MPKGFLKNGTKRIPPSRKGIRLTDNQKRKISIANKGKVRTPEQRLKYSVCKRGEKSPSWKGNQVKYSALHSWVRKILGTPRYCSNCQSKVEKKYEWANISKAYKRELSDWIRLCTKCHIGYDSGRILLDDKKWKKSL